MTKNLKSCRFKIDIRNLRNFDLRTWKSQKFTLNELLLTKVYEMMQKLKRNWRVSSKLTWGIWGILTWALELLENLRFWPKYIMFELKKYSGVMFNGTEYWCKIWRKTDLYFQKWHEETSKLSPEHNWKSKN